MAKWVLVFYHPPQSLTLERLGVGVIRPQLYATCETVCLKVVLKYEKVILFIGLHSVVFVIIACQIVV